MEIIIACTVVILGIFLGVWSIFDTRKKYYNDYKRRKRHGPN